MTRALDLDQLRRAIAEGPSDDGACAIVTRRFLEQVARELSEARIAIARLQRSQFMAEVIDGLNAGSTA